MQNPFDTSTNPFDTPAPSTDPPQSQPTEPNSPELPAFSVNSGSPIMNFEPQETQIPVLDGSQKIISPFEDAFEQHPVVQNQPTQQSSPTTEKRKFIITDLYWLKNLKPQYNKQLSPNECNLLVIAYNAEFENLRLSFANAQDMTPTTVAVPTGARQNSVNIFSETCREILAFFEGLNANNVGSSFPFTLNNCERIISLSNNSWVPNETVIRILNQAVIELHTKQPNGTQQMFTLTTWQVKAFLDCCRFMTNGEAWKMKLHTLIHKD